MVTTRVAGPSSPRTGEKNETLSQTRGFRWASTVPMTGVRYYRFLPDPAESDEMVGEEIEHRASRAEDRPSVRGG